MSAPPRPHARRLPAWLLAAALGAVFLMAVKAYHAYDVWHHIRCGWHAWNFGPGRLEPFSCTGRVLGLRWLQYEWLAQILIYLSHEFLGVNGTILALAALYTGAFALLALACRERGAPVEAAVVAVLVSALAVSQRFYTRPEVFSMVAFGFLLWAVERARRGRFGPLCALPLVFALWANLHGAYVAGWALLGVAAVGPELDRRLGLVPPEPSGRRLSRRVGLILAACVGAVLLNPYGFHVLEVPFKLSRSRVVTGTINEWMPFPLHLWLTVYHLFIPLLVVSCAAGWRRLRAADVLTLLLFGYMAATARRHVALAAFVTAPIAAGQLAPFFAWLRRARLRARLVQASLGLLCAASVLLVHGWKLSTLRLGIDPSKYPEMAGDFLDFARIDGNLFNDYADGNYLMWRRYPHNLVFIDGRIDTYGEQVMRLWTEVKSAALPGRRIQYFSEKFVSEGWQNILRRFSVAACVVRFKVDEPEDRARPAPAAQDRPPPTDPLVDALWNDPGWALVFWDDIILIFVRRENVGDLHVYRTRPDTFNVTRLKTREAWAAAVQDLQARIDLGPRFDCATARVCMANALQARGLFKPALPHLRRAFELQPYDAARAYNLAAGLLHLDQNEEAARFFRLALRLGSKEPEKTWNGLGNCHLGLRRYAEALRCFRRAVAVNPGYVFAHLSMSVVHERLGDRAAAIAAVRAALRVEPRNQAALERLKALENPRPSDRK